MKHSYKPKVNDTVRLNDQGLISLFGTTVGLAHMKTLQMKVTWVDSESITYPEETFELRVDNPDINKFMLNNRSFDLVSRPVDDPCPDCGAQLVGAAGGGVVCSNKCGYWFCF